MTKLTYLALSNYEANLTVEEELEYAVTNYYGEYISVHFYDMWWMGKDLDELSNH